jgi:hypothetical protein
MQSKIKKRWQIILGYEGSENIFQKQTEILVDRGGHW